MIKTKKSFLQGNEKNNNEIADQKIFYQFPVAVFNNTPVIRKGTADNHKIPTNLIENENIDVNFQNKRRQRKIQTRQNARLNYSTIHENITISEECESKKERDNKIYIMGQNKPPREERCKSRKVETKKKLQKRNLGVLNEDLEDMSKTCYPVNKNTSIKFCKENDNRRDKYRLERACKFDRIKANQRSY